MKKIVIIGAGISGLATAYYLQKLPCEITIIEKTDRVGGWIKTIEHEGFCFELGPRGFRPQDLTLALADEVGAKVVDANRAAHKRYLCDGQKLSPLSFGFLLKSGMATALLKEWFVKPTQAIDESISSFFSRRFNPKIVDRLIVPMTHGIFAQEPDRLSMRACFPALWRMEQEHGSLVRALFKKKRGPKRAALCSFMGGMQALPDALAHKLECPILFNEQIQKIDFSEKGATLELSSKKLEADHVIAAAPDPTLEKWLPEATSLSIVNIGFHTDCLPLNGFGYLNQQIGADGLLGVTFDSKIFPELNQSGQTRLCFMFQGTLTPEQAKSRSSKILQSILKVERPIDVLHVHHAKEAIFRYAPGHLQQLQQLEASLPSALTLTGARYYGVGVNDCIARAKSLASTLLHNK